MDTVLHLRKEFELVDDDDEELPAVSTVGMILEGLIVSMVVPGEFLHPVLLYYLVQRFWYDYSAVE